MLRYYPIVVISLFITCSSFPQDRNSIAISAAFFDILQQSEPSFEMRTELRAGKIKLFGHPFGGIMVNTEGAIHLYVGMYYDIFITDEFIITPSFAPGIYENNNSKDLHYFLEFRSQLEVSFRFDHGARIGLSFNHISNASLAKENPGVESLALTYVFPL
ncbi:MAG: acyloxyacyl hydrolase [Ignavibacteria bacterium]|jgi:hypothetical protein